MRQARERHRQGAERRGKLQTGSTGVDGPVSLKETSEGRKCGITARQGSLLIYGRASPLLVLLFQLPLAFDVMLH